MLCHGQPGLELIASLISIDFNTIFGAGVCLSPNIIQYSYVPLLPRPVWPLSSLGHGSCPDPIRHALQALPLHDAMLCEVKVDAMKSTAQCLACFFAPLTPLLYQRFVFEYDSAHLGGVHRGTKWFLIQPFWLDHARWLYLIAARAEDLPISEGLNSGGCTSRNQV